MKRCPKCNRNLEYDAEFCSKCGSSIPTSEQPSLASEKTTYGEDTPEIDDLIGETVANYRIEERIGQGGMGVVYRAVHPEINKTVAIKFLPPAFSKSDKFVARFKREAAAMAELVHPNIVQIQNMGSYQGLYYLIMEYIPGKTVAEILQDQGRIEWHGAIHISKQVLQALQVAHSQGMLHRDIKPGNILIADDGTVKVADFGLVKMMGIGDEVSINEARSRLSISAISDARQDGVALTIEGSPIGTFDYMSPEQYRGDSDIDEHTDIYSFGMTLYKMLTGRLARAFAKPPSIYDPSIPERLDEVCVKSLEEEPEGRYWNVDELLVALGEVEKDIVPSESAKIEKEKREEEEQRKRAEELKHQEIIQKPEEERQKEIADSQSESQVAERGKDKFGIGKVFLLFLLCALISATVGIVLCVSLSNMSGPTEYIFFSLGYVISFIILATVMKKKKSVMSRAALILMSIMTFFTCLTSIVFLINLIGHFIKGEFNFH